MAKLRKVHVTTGVSWVEAPDLGLYVLCGCPADAVKHLMRRGLIVETETSGVQHETGPQRHPAVGRHGAERRVL